MTEQQFIGIDFGTTNTAVCVMTKNETGVNFTNYGEGGFPFSSIVAIPKDDNDETLQFGRSVRERMQELSKTHRIIKSMKTYLDSDEEFVVGGKRYSSVDITAAFLTDIKEYIYKNYNIDITESVLACPVDFSPLARKRLKKAAETAGIKVAGFVSESTAAYMACREQTKAYRKIMVVDWGGGTLDISILHIKGSSVFEDAVYGEQIGGDDIDLELAYNIHARLANKYHVDKSFDDMEPEDRDQLINVCEQAKIEFSDFDDDFPIQLRNYGEFGTRVESLSYNDFCEIVMSIVKTRALKVINTALQRAGLTISAIDAVIISGGSSGLRPFESAAMKIFGDKIIIPNNLQWVVAHGAAMFAASGGNQRLSETLGVVLSDTSVYPILEKEKDYVGCKKATVNFALTEDSQSAQFIFSNENQTVNYGILNVPTKGYLDEKISLEAEIDPSMIVTITLKNPTMGKNCIEKIQINKLPFYYELN